MGTTIKCHACGGRMIRDLRPDEVIYKGHAVKIGQPGWYCTRKGCDEVVLDGPDSAVT